MLFYVFLKSHELNCLYLINLCYQSSLLDRNRTDLEIPLVAMIHCIIRSKALVPHDIIQAETGAAPIITKALFQSMASKQKYSRLAHTSSKLAKHQDNIVGMLENMLNTETTLLGGP